MESPPSAQPDVGRRMVDSRLAGLFALVSYCAMSVAFFGRGVVASPNTTVVGDRGSDKTIFIWAFEWWPHALAHAHDPLTTGVVWAPRGMDLSWVADSPGAAFLATPVTAIVGPVVAYNVAALLAPATAAWTGFLLARWVTGSFWPALVGGFVFGFSSFEISHTIAHLHLTLACLIPVCALLVLRRAAGGLTRTRFVIYLSAALALQFLFSTEVFVLMLGVACLALGLGLLVLERERRPTLVATTVDSLGALAVACMLVSPYLYHLFVVTGTGWIPARSPFEAAADLANFVVPRGWTWLQFPGSARIARRFTANPVESTAYLGLPLVAIVVHFALKRGRPRTQVLLVVLLAATAFVSLGPRIRLAGKGVALGPWQLLARLPVTGSALPVRLTLFVALFAGLVSAIWLAEKQSSRVRWLAAAAAVIALLPTASTAYWTADVPRSNFFARGTVVKWFDENDILLVLPYGSAGWSMTWQAESGFAYRMAGGRLGNLPREEGSWHPLLLALAGREPVTPAIQSRFDHSLQRTPSTRS